MKMSDDDDRNSYFPKIMAYFSVDATKKEALDKWIYVEKSFIIPFCFISRFIKHK